MSRNATKVLLAGVLLLVSSSSAFAAGPYISAAGGLSIFHDSDLTVTGFPTLTASYDKQLAFNLSAGYDFDGGRIEGEFGYKTAEMQKLSSGGNSVNISGVDVNVMSYMINGYYDIRNESIATPYIGAGIGLINGEMKGNSNSVDDNVFGYQLIAGVGVNVNKNITIDYSYRLQGAASDFEKDGGKLSYMSSNIFAGMRWNF